MELQILDAIQRLHCPILDHFFVAVTCLGNSGIIWILLGLFLLSQKKYRFVGIGIFLCLIMTAISGELMIKNIVCRPRPFTYRPDLTLLVSKPVSYSFPSGHTASSFTCAIFLLLCKKKLGIPAFILACLIAFSRLYLYVHFPTDILGGIVLGSCCAIFIYQFVYKKKLSTLSNELTRQ